jgi:hypothetical protein
MTRNEILEVANQFYKQGGVSEREIAFARYMMKYEREACATAVEGLRDKSGVNEDGNAWLTRVTRGDCANAIRARGEA